MGTPRTLASKHVGAAALLVLGVTACRRHPDDTHHTPAAGASVREIVRSPPASASGANAAGSPPVTATWAQWPIPTPPSSALAHPQSYDTSTPGVVIDEVTGLMWQRAVDKNRYVWAAAHDHCEALELAGHDDWHLPTRMELVSIVDTTRSQPSIDPVAFPATPAEWFWTSSPSAEASGNAWYVYFYFGYPKIDETTNEFCVRCVRGASASSAPAASPVSAMGKPYEADPDTVRDVRTGLTWQRRVPKQARTFEGARDYCKSLELGEKSGWRVPTMNELLSTIDESKTGTLADPMVFPDTPPESFWTSSPFADTKKMAWHVYFDHGTALYGLLDATYRVRCVR